MVIHSTTVRFSVRTTPARPTRTTTTTQITTQIVVRQGVIGSSVTTVTCIVMEVLLRVTPTATIASTVVMSVVPTLIVSVLVVLKVVVTIALVPIVIDVMQPRIVTGTQHPLHVPLATSVLVAVHA